MAKRKTYTVNSASGLNLRSEPTKSAKIIRVLEDGEKVTVNTGAEAPVGWVAVQDGYVMADFLK